jgi:hypothetical protein
VGSSWPPDVRLNVSIFRSSCHSSTSRPSTSFLASLIASASSAHRRSARFWTWPSGPTIHSGQFERAPPRGALVQLLSGVGIRVRSQYDALAIFPQALKPLYPHFTLCQQGSSDSACMVFIMSFVEITELKVRRKPRRQVLDTGLIRFGEFSACCALRNFSEMGAALDVGPGNFPDKFTLIVVRKKKIYSCDVIWRRGKRIGVSFC